MTAAGAVTGTVAESVSVSAAVAVAAAASEAEAGAGTVAAAATAAAAAAGYRVRARHRRQPGWLSLHNQERPLCSDRLPACRGQRQMPPRVGGKVASLGVPGTALCRIDPPARGALRTMPYRARCLALFSPRKGAWHRSHRDSTGSCRPPASHRRGRNPSNSPPKRPRRWGDAGPPKADRKAGAVRIGNSVSGRGSVRLPRFGGHLMAVAVVESVEAVGKGTGAAAGAGAGAGNPIPPPNAASRVSSPKPPRARRSPRRRSSPRMEARFSSDRRPPFRPRASPGGC